MSRRHFEIRWDAAHHVHVGADLESSNGSFVDGIPVTSPIALRSGSVIRLGGVVCVYERAPGSDGAAATETEAIPGSSAAAHRLRLAVMRNARDPSSILIVGETGTGKEFVARELHRLSSRKGPFVALNCAALAPQLVESELFGHVRGAFSGALQEQPGLFRAAHGGTLLLDEIGELPLSLQAKLLRVLQEKEVRPVGAVREHRVDVRVLAATHRDLASMVEDGSFRRDLYARLSMREIDVPPLRQRRADVLAWLTQLHARRQAQREATDPAPLQLDPSAAEAVLRCEFPENLRGLDKLAHQLGDVYLGTPLTLVDLPIWVTLRGSTADDTADRAREESPARSARPPAPTREELALFLDQHGGSIRAAARHFGRDRKQIYRWVQTWGLKSN